MGGSGEIKFSVIPRILRHVGPARFQNRFFFDVEKERDQKL